MDIEEELKEIRIQMLQTYGRVLVLERTVEQLLGIIKLNTTCFEALAKQTKKD